MSIKKFTPTKGNGRDVYVLKDAKLIYKNFSGTRGKFPGSSSVNVVVSEEDAKKLGAWGLPCNCRENPDGENQYSVRLNVKFNVRPPEVIQILPSGSNLILDEELIKKLDDLSIASANVAWTYGYGSGKPVAYLNKMEVSIVPSIFSDDASDYYIETDG